MKAIDPEEYLDPSQKSALGGNHFGEPLEDLEDYSEIYSILLGLVTIETQATFRSLTPKKPLAESTDSLQTIVDHCP